MKSCPFILIPLFAIAVVLGVCVGAANSVQAGWQLAWSDEFDGNSLNANNWAFDIGTGPPYPGWGNNELEYYTSRTNNAFVADGLLHVVARQESYNGSSYTSAKLKTSGFSQTYGRFEFYAKLPAGQGYWPALWMMPQTSTYGGWAASGEIDVMENRGSDPTTVLGTIHFGGSYPNNDLSHGPSYHFPAGDSVTNFHLYAVERTSTSIRWYVDNQLFQTQTSWWSSGGSYPAPFDQPFYIIMNLAVGGKFGGNPDGSTVFPGEMQVDYVRAYTWLSEPLPPPVLKLRVPVDDAIGTTTPSDTNDGGANVTLQMMNGAGNAGDYHGALNSGVTGVLTGSRALDFSSNGANQPGIPGPLAAVTNANLGFGTVSNFVVSLWFKQNAMMAAGANIGPRLFVLGAGNPNDSGAANSIGLKFQTANQIYFQLGGVTASASFPTNLPTNAWLFVAAVYDGALVKFYQGTDTSPASLINTTPAGASIDFGSSGALHVGNRQDRLRSFNGWIDDFRFYTGVGDSNFVESVRLLAVTPSTNFPVTLNFRTGTNGVELAWPSGVLQSATNVSGPWLDIGVATSPFTVTPNEPKRFYRVRLQ